MSNCTSENKLPCLEVGCEPRQTFPSGFTLAQWTEHQCFTINTNFMLIWSGYVSVGLCLPHTVLRQSQDINIPLSQSLTKGILFLAMPLELILSLIVKAQDMQKSSGFQSTINCSCLFETTHSLLLRTYFRINLVFTVPFSRIILETNRTLGI